MRGASVGFFGYCLFCMICFRVVIFACGGTVVTILCVMHGFVELSVAAGGCSVIGSCDAIVDSGVSDLLGPRVAAAGPEGDVARVWPDWAWLVMWRLGMLR